MALNFSQSGKGRSNPRQYGTKKATSHYLSKTTIGLLTICQKLLFGTRLLRQEKKASRKVLSLASWIANKYSNRPEASWEIKLKSNESQLPKFYELKPTERKFNPRTLLKKQPFWRLKWKLKLFDETKKKNTQIQTTLFPPHPPPDTLSDKFPQITLKFATLYLFYPFLSCFFCIKFPSKNLYCHVIFLNHYLN